MESWKYYTYDSLDLAEAWNRGVSGGDSPWIFVFKKYFYDEGYGVATIGLSL